jgi:antitoxin HicB
MFKQKLDYLVMIEPLSAEDGGGFVATVPDLPGCMSDGETPEEALTNVQDAIAAWKEEARSLGRSIPKPSRHHVAAE